MLELARPARFILETCMSLKKGSKLLLISDTGPWQMRLGETLLDVASSMGVEVALAIVKPAEIAGDEVPSSIGSAMQSVDRVLMLTSKITLGHSLAAKAARDKGVKIQQMNDIPPGYLEREFKLEDLQKIQETTEKVAAKLTAADSVRLTTTYGTDVTMSIKGRTGLCLNALAGRGSLPDYAEAPISPVEGTAEGTIVIDMAVLGWGYVLREPLKYTVKQGKVIDISGPSEEVGRMKKILATDEGANNIAELAVGTSHTIAGPVIGSRWDAARLGNVHIGLGRSVDIGGKSQSRIHIDGVMTHATLLLDGVALVKDGALQL
jgi:leucyl aminopeptidase (aminopeptidase T)